ncbi:SDR family oxidoreductase [Rikenella microfusus]|uniref:SDR family oxidoreductase n=1 Tax=Rikenella microfusus TaxID=28139 RepID=UPI001DC965A0|nr:SDR family oxidoreductase [Rikenella microfusus]HJE87821.1 SDR family oxidoreductase [Rikenella microfusus]
MEKENLYDLSGRVAVVTGGYGVLGGSMALFLARQGAKVAILGRNAEKGEAKAREIAAATGGETIFLQADVLDKPALERACAKLTAEWGAADILLNAAGGNQAGATIAPDRTIFDLDTAAMRGVVDLNFMGTVLPTLVFGKAMADAGRKGSIVNISSMAAQGVITRVVGYSASKAAIDNFTRWMAVEMAKKFGEGVRVNAIAPGFFLTEQNRTLLTNPDGSLTDRSRDIIAATPYGRFGEPEELNGTLGWLASDASAFVTGVVVPVDGGFSIFTGV